MTSTFFIGSYEIIPLIDIADKTVPIAIRIKEKIITSTFCVLFGSDAIINKGHIKKTNVTTSRNGINFLLPSPGTDPLYKILSIICQH